MADFYRVYVVHEFITVPDGAYENGKAAGDRIVCDHAKDDERIPVREYDNIDDAIARAKKIAEAGHHPSIHKTREDGCTVYTLCSTEVCPVKERKIMSEEGMSVWETEEFDDAAIRKMIWRDAGIE